MIPQGAGGGRPRHAFELRVENRLAGDVQALQGRHAAQVRGIDLLADAVLIAGHEGGQHRVGEHDGSHLIRNPAGNVERRHVGLAGRIHDARAGQAHIVKRRLGRVRSKRAVTGSAGVDELGVVLGQRLVIEAQPACHALAEVLDKDIRLLHQLVYDLPGLGFFEVERKALLVAVIGLKIKVVALAGADHGAGNAHHAPTGVAADPLFELDDLRPEVAEHHRRDRPLLENCPVDNTNAV